MAYDPEAKQDLAASEAADRATIAEYASDPDNGQTLRMLLEERQGRWKPDVRAEIGRRHLAFLRQQAQREHPGMTRRERLFPNAPPIPASREEREKLAQDIREAGGREIHAELAAYLAGVQDACNAGDYERWVGPLVRRVRERIEAGEIGQSIELEERFSIVWNPYWRRKFRSDRADAGGFAPSEAAELAVASAKEM